MAPKHRPKIVLPDHEVTVDATQNYAVEFLVHASVLIVAWLPHADVPPERQFVKDWAMTDPVMLTESLRNMELSNPENFENMATEALHWATPIAIRQMEAVIEAAAASKGIHKGKGQGIGEE